MWACIALIFERIKVEKVRTLPRLSTACSASPAPGQQLNSLVWAMGPPELSKLGLQGNAAFGIDSCQ